MINKFKNRPIPSPGPRPYDEQLSGCFFGRDEEITRLLNHAKGQWLSVLTAESASGKTSLLQAGLVPELRKLRFKARKSNDHPLPSYPLLLNQWLGRAGGAQGVDFLRLFVSETDRYLGWCVSHLIEESANQPDLKQQATEELAALVSVRHNIRKIAIDLRLAQLINGEGEGELIPLPVPEESWGDIRKMLEDFHSILDVLTETLGPILLILDQFEEVLADPILGGQALELVENIFHMREEDIKQFISLRSDALNLLLPLERRGLILGQRRVEITPLMPDAVRAIVSKMSSIAGLVWDDESNIDHLIDTFTKFTRDGGRPIDVNMLGLQVVLLGLFTRLIKENDAERITSQDICQYCSLLGGKRVTEEDLLSKWFGCKPVPGVKNGNHIGLLVNEAPRFWIEQCLKEPFSGDSSGFSVDKEEIIPAIIKPMVMRMAEGLVTPAGFKRPLTFEELTLDVFRNDLKKRGSIAAGRAKLEGWSDEQRERVLENTCREALRRLVQGHVLKQRGGEISDSYYELVHDQFGLPLKSWAQDIECSPYADLGWPYAITDKEFSWRDKRLNDYIADEKEAVTGALKRVQALAWVGCAVQDVDFSDLRIEGCNFSRTFFLRCKFSKSQFECCDFTQALFEHCTLSECSFILCDCDKIALTEGSSLAEVKFIDGSMRYAEFSSISLLNCDFMGKEQVLPMKNLSLINSDCIGRVRFEGCQIDGATIGADSGKEENEQLISTGDLFFKRSDLNGIELKNMHFISGTLILEECVAQGALFEQLLFSPTKTGSRGIFRETTLHGAVFLGCQLNNTEFTRLGASMLVFRDLMTNSGIKPTSLANVHFSDVAMENFYFSQCNILGEIDFNRCRLAGGTIEGSRNNDSSKVGGCIRFLETSDLTALEFLSLSFVEQQLEITDCIANAVYFKDVEFSTTGGMGGALFKQSPMAGGMFHNCSIHGVKFEGDIEKRVFLEALTIKGDEDRSSLGDCKFSHAVMDGFILDGVRIDGALDFINCSLCAARIGNHKDKVTNAPEPRNPMPISGDITFDRNCDLRAIHLNNIRFDEGSLFKVNGSPCDGAIFQDIYLIGMIVFEKSKLLRAKFWQIKVEGENAQLDLHDSDLFYAELDDELLKNDESDFPTTLKIRYEQIKAGREMTSIRKRFS